MMERLALRDGGLLLYDAAFLTPVEIRTLFEYLLASVPWRQESGRFGPMPRLTAWYADDAITYSYSGVTHVGLRWTTPLSELKTRLESLSGASFNSVLLNRYRDGQDSLGWHADNEKELGTDPVIASVSLGAVRCFRLKHLQSRETIKFDLASGSLLVMAGTTQHHWHHSIAKTKQFIGERINLTYRWIQG